MSAGQCQETTGFRFAHACERPAVHRCAVSNLGLCDAHAHQVAWGVLEEAGLLPAGEPHSAPMAWISTSVARRLDARDRATADATRSPNRVHSTLFRSRWQSDPFFYDYNRYDRWDFQQGDAASLRRAVAADADEDFEHDMQGS